LTYYQNALQTPTPNTGFAWRLCSVHAPRPQHAHDALEDLTAFPQRCHSVPTTRCLTRCANAKPRRLIFCMLKINAAAWRYGRLHSAHMALLAIAQRVPRRSAMFLNAIRTPLWCDRSFAYGRSKTPTMDITLNVFIVSSMIYVSILKILFCNLCYVSFFYF